MGKRPSLTNLGTPTLASGYAAIFTLGTPTATTLAISMAVTRNTTSAAFNWDGGATGIGNGNWSTSANWTTGGISYTGVYPGLVATDTATVDLTGQSSPSIALGGAYTVANLNLLNTGTLTLTGTSGNAPTVSNGLTIASGQTLAGVATLNTALTVTSGGADPRLGDGGGNARPDQPVRHGRHVQLRPGLCRQPDHHHGQDHGPERHGGGDIPDGLCAPDLHALPEHGALTAGSLTLNSTALTYNNTYYSYALATTANQVNLTATRLANTFTWNWGDKTTGPDPNGTWSDPVNWASNNGLVPSSGWTTLSSATPPMSRPGRPAAAR